MFLESAIRSLRVFFLILVVNVWMISEIWAPPKSQMPVLALSSSDDRSSLPRHKTPENPGNYDNQEEPALEGKNTATAAAGDSRNCGVRPSTPVPVSVPDQSQLPQRPAAPPKHIDGESNYPLTQDIMDENDLDEDGQRLRKFLTAANQHTQFNTLLPLEINRKKTKTGEMLRKFNFIFPGLTITFIDERVLRQRSFLAQDLLMAGKDINEVIISYVLGDRLGECSVTAQENPNFLSDLIESGLPLPIAYRPSSPLRSSHLVRCVKRMFSSTEDLRFFCPSDQLLLQKLRSVWPLLRPCGLFRLMGNMLKEDMEKMLAEKDDRHIDSIAPMAVSFFLLARRYEAYDVRDLARSVHTTLFRDYRAKRQRNEQLEELMTGIDTFVADPRFWEGEVLDFTLWFSGRLQ